MDDLLLIVLSCIVLGPAICMLVWLFIVVCEDLLYRLAGLYLRVMTGLRRDD